MTTPLIIVLAVVAIVAVHCPQLRRDVLVPPWLLVAIAILAWIKFRPPAPTARPSARHPRAEAGAAHADVSAEALCGKNSQAASAETCFTHEQCGRA